MSARWPIGVAMAALAGALAGPVSAQARADAAFTRWDADHNGVLSREEFEQGWKARAQARRKAALDAAQARLRGQFEAIDANDDAAIDAGEYPSLVLVRRAGASAPPLSSFDADGNGRLGFGEYLQLVRKLARAPRAPRAGGQP